MRRIFWALILIPLLVGAVYGALAVVTQNGGITVVTGSLGWVTAPDFTGLTVAAGGLSPVSVSFSLKNTGQIPLILTCSSDLPSGFTVACIGLPTSTLAAGATVSASVTFQAASTVAAGTTSFIFTISGNP